MKLLAKPGIGSRKSHRKNNFLNALFCIASLRVPIAPQVCNELRIVPVFVFVRKINILGCRDKVKRAPVFSLYTVVSRFLPLLFTDRSLFQYRLGGEGVGGVWGGSLDFQENRRGRITENFGGIQSEDQSNLLGQCQFERIQNNCAHSTER